MKIDIVYYILLLVYFFMCTCYKNYFSIVLLIEIQFCVYGSQNHNQNIIFITRQKNKINTSCFCILLITDESIGYVTCGKY